MEDEPDGVSASQQPDFAAAGIGAQCEGPGKPSVKYWKQQCSREDGAPGEVSEVLFSQVCLGPGDMLFVPAGWWHAVEGLGDTSVAVNWYFEHTTNF